MSLTKDPVPPGAGRTARDHRIAAVVATEQAWATTCTDPVALSRRIETHATTAAAASSQESAHHVEALMIRDAAVGVLLATAPAVDRAVLELALVAAPNVIGEVLANPVVDNAMAGYLARQSVALVENTVRSATTMWADDGAVFAAFGAAYDVRAARPDGAVLAQVFATTVVPALLAHVTPAQPLLARRRTGGTINLVRPRAIDALFKLGAWVPAMVFPDLYERLENETQRVVRLVSHAPVPIAVLRRIAERFAGPQVTSGGIVDALAATDRTRHDPVIRARLFDTTSWTALQHLASDAVGTDFARVLAAYAAQDPEMGLRLLEEHTLPGCATIDAEALAPYFAPTLPQNLRLRALALVSMYPPATTQGAPGAASPVHVGRTP